MFTFITSMFIRLNCASCKAINDHISNVLDFTDHNNLASQHCVDCSKQNKQTVLKDIREWRLHLCDSHLANYYIEREDHQEGHLEVRNNICVCKSKTCTVNANQQSKVEINLQESFQDYLLRSFSTSERMDIDFYANACSCQFNLGQYDTIVNVTDYKRLFSFSPMQGVRMHRDVWRQNNALDVSIKIVLAIEQLAIFGGYEMLLSCTTKSATELSSQLKKENDEVFCRYGINDFKSIIFKHHFIDLFHDLDNALQKMKNHKRIGNKVVGGIAMPIRPSLQRLHVMFMESLNYHCLNHRQWQKTLDNKTRTTELNQAEIMQLEYLQSANVSIRFMRLCFVNFETILERIAFNGTKIEMSINPLFNNVVLNFFNVMQDICSLAEKINILYGNNETKDILILFRFILNSTINQKFSPYDIWLILMHINHMYQSVFQTGIRKLMHGPAFL